MLDEFWRDFFVREYVRHAEIFHVHHKSRRQIRRPRDLVNEHEGQPKIRRLKRSAPRSNNPGKGTLHRLCRLARDDAEQPLSHPGSPQISGDNKRVRFRRRCNLEVQDVFRTKEFAGGVQHDGKIPGHFPRATPGKKPDQIRIAFTADPAGLQSVHHGMTDKYRAQTGFVVELGFKRKNAEHEIEKARHFFDSAAMPGPNLWADVIDYFGDLAPEYRRFFVYSASGHVVR